MALIFMKCVSWVLAPFRYSRAQHIQHIMNVTNITHNRESFNRYGGDSHDGKTSKTRTNEEDTDFETIFREAIEDERRGNGRYGR